jgi:5-methylthioadenosine/S-adenosylhomocysteine deaminase
MATREGAAALHLEHEIGTIEPGKSGDIVVLDMTGWSMLPAGDPASQIVFGASAQMVRHVVVAGRPVVIDGQLVTCETDALKGRVNDAWEATRQRMESIS